MPNITLIVPCYNEGAALNLFYSQVNTVLTSLPDINFSYLFINDGSKDNTLDVLRTLQSADKKVSYISFTRNFGKEIALLAGLDHAKGDAVIIMDADLQHPPSLIPQMVEYWQAGFDDICTKRTNRQAEGCVKKFLTKTFYAILRHSTKLEVREDVGDFRLLDRRCVNALKLMRERQRCFKGLYSWIGYNKKELEFAVQPRIAGKSSWNYWSLFSLAIEDITSFTTLPLRLASLLGLVVAVGTICYMCLVLIKTFIFGDPVAGYPTLITVILFLGAVQLLALGIIGEYLGRVFLESKERPLYLIDEYNGERAFYQPWPHAETSYQKTASQGDFNERK